MELVHEGRSTTTTDMIGEIYKFIKCFVVTLRFEQVVLLPVPLANKNTFLPFVDA